METAHEKRTNLQSRCPCSLLLRRSWGSFRSLSEPPLEYLSSCLSSTLCLPSCSCLLQTSVEVIPLLDFPAFAGSSPLLSCSPTPLLAKEFSEHWDEWVDEDDDFVEDLSSSLLLPVWLLLDSWQEKQMLNISNLRYVTAQGSFHANCHQSHHNYLLTP